MEESIPVKLRAIAQEIEDNPDHWTQGEYAKDVNGFGVNFDHEEATCWCADGFLRREFRDVPTYGMVWDAVDKAAPSVASYCSFVDYNDAEGRTPSDIVTLFRKAADIYERSKANGN